MNKRCIVNVATGDFYCKMQSRLLDSFMKSVDHVTILEQYQKPIKVNFQLTTDRGIDLIYWKNCLPAGSRSHSESPYGFKVHAIKAAYEKGYTTILWLDSPAFAVKEDISPIFEKIEKEGYYAMSHIDPLENWVGDRALKEYAMDRSALVGKNLPSGTCYGFDLLNKETDDLFWLLMKQEEDGLFQSEKVSEVGWHRHDEAILALNLITLDLPVFTFDPLFQSDSPECVIKSGGE